MTPKYAIHKLNDHQHTGSQLDEDTVKYIRRALSRQIYKPLVGSLCPTCHSPVYHTSNYCAYCGQHIDRKAATE